MRLTLSALLIASSVSSYSSAATYFSGNTINEWMESEAKGQRYSTSLLLGYVAGVVDATDTILFCLPSGVTAGQSVAIVKKYVKEHPEHWNSSGSAIVATALSGAFPCSD